MRLHHPESRIAIIFVLLVLIVQLAGLYAIRSYINDNAHATVRDQLDTGEKLFAHLLTQQTKDLIQDAQIFAADRGLQQAIQTQDSPAIIASLTQYQNSSGAALTGLVKPDRQMQLVAPSPTAFKLERMILALTADADQTGHATAITNLGPQLLQISVTSIKAPQMLGWVVTGFPIAQNLVAGIAQLSPLQVSILSRDAQNTWVADSTNLTQADIAGLIAQLPTVIGETSATSKIQIGHTESSAHIFRLAQDTAQTSIVVLQREPAAIATPYQRLQLILLLAALASTGLTVFGGLWILRRIAVPLRQLTESARRLGDGEYYHDQIELTREDEIGELSRAFGNMRDGIANRELEIRHLAYWDKLTNLPNRAQFVSLLDQALERCRKTHTSCHVLMMDLDRFKQVNDVLGHTLGDALLQQVAQRLLALNLKATDQVARLGGDEFALLLPDSRLDEAQALAAHILTILEQPIALDDQTIDLGASIGIAGVPMHANDTETLLRHVDVAMYVAKARGNEVVVYDPAIDKTDQDSLTLLGDLRRAIERNEFHLYMQPKIALDSGKVIGAEALLRWMHPKKGLIQPDDFIPFAEKTGLIRAMTCWVMEQTAIAINDWKSQGLNLKVSVNLSTHDLLDQDLPEKFMAILVRHQVASSSFCLEITESAIMSDPVRALQTLDRLFAMGVQLSIDDFGTGYSSLAYLKRLPVHELKIDKSFVIDMEFDRNDTSIVRSTIDLGHNMGLRVVAEGVETHGAQLLLSSMGCDQAQGYFISKPMHVELLLDWTRQWVPSLPYDNMI